MSFTRLAFIESIDGSALTRAQYDDFTLLAETILKARTGRSVPTGALHRAVMMIYKDFTEFTTPSFFIRRYLSSHLSKAEFVQKNTPRYNKPSDDMGTLLGTSTYNICSSANPRELLKVFNLLHTPAPGEIFLVFNMGERPGFEFAQLRDLLVQYAPSIREAADRFGDTKLPQLLASLKRARLTVPNHALMFLQESQVRLNYRMVYGAIDANLTSTPTFYPKAKLGTLDKGLQQLWAQKTRDVPQDSGKLKYVDQLLRGKTVLVIGRPPTGWSLDRLNSLLRPLKSSASTDSDHNADLVIYNPDERRLLDERLKYRDAKLPKITYDEAIALLMQGVPQN